MTAYTLNIKKQCLQHAILDQLKAPPAVFRDVIRAHFKHKQLSLKEQLTEWSKEQPGCKKLAENIEAELVKCCSTCKCTTGIAAILY